MPLVPPCTSTVSPVAKPAARDQVVVHRERILRQGRGLDQAPAARDRQDLALGRGHVLGVAAAVDEGADLVAESPTRDALAERRDRAGDFEPQDRRRTRRRRIVALALHDVGARNAGRRDGDQHLAGPRLRRVALLDS